MKKKVILLLGKLPPPYMGPSIATQIILKSSLNNSFNLVHLDTKAYDDLNELGKWSFKKLKRNIGIYFRMRKLIKKNQPAIVWIPISQTTTGFLKDAVFIWIAALSGSNVVLHLRGSNFKKWIDNSFSVTKWFVKKTMSKCSGIIVLGNNLRYIFRPYFKEENIYVVPNGADYVIPPSQKNIKKVNLIYLANLQASKGIEDVLSAVAILHDEFKEHYHLDVIGKWRNEETKQNCLKIIEDNGLNVTVHPPEVSHDKLQYLSNSDIFVFPPREPEGHPWVIVEALAAGLPVISTNQGAIVESVIHGKNGFIVEPANPSSIAESVAELIKNKELRQRMGEESRIHYLASFTEEKMVSRLVITFEHVLKD
ncbi:MAG: glycosyltransferase family 4 protein [Bacteroidota bacterium]